MIDEPGWGQGEFLHKTPRTELCCQHGVQDVENLKNKEQGGFSCTPGALPEAELGSCKCRPGAGMILVDPFQLRMFHDSGMFRSSSTPKASLKPQPPRLFLNADFWLPSLQENEFLIFLDEQFPSAGFRHGFAVFWELWGFRSCPAWPLELLPALLLQHPHPWAQPGVPST